ncbi:nucleotidyltransferase domain-containing protein [Alkalimarinus coralli]|uniref:nucleotidyltransferase domain-containing protein n=1 Tax=Alkalimarinus coralli TaxID=2935863 RepID=UPI00202B0F09|nr:nucleotidyltransferase domain-containing protein [Alkalimarinus coralli]
MSSPLAEILFKEYRRRVLGLLLLQPDSSYHVREIARLTGTLAGTLHKELSKLAEAGLLVKDPQGKQVYYRANKDCPIYEELASILRKTSGVADVLAEQLRSLAEGIDAVFVFGSVASGKATAESDVDVLVIGEVAFADVVKALYPAQETLGREINPKVYSHAEWQQARKEQNNFIKDVMEKPKLFVIGTKDDIG